MPPIENKNTMSTLNLEYSREDAKTLVKLAFEATKGIETYHDNGIRIVGKTGFSLSSYGEIITVEIPENQPSEKETVISVSSEKEVSMNVTANPQKYEDRFFSVLNKMRGRPVDELLDEVGHTITNNGSKEVQSTEQQADGSSYLGLILALVFILMFFFMMMPLLAL